MHSEHCIKHTKCDERVCAFREAQNKNLSTSLFPIFLLLLLILHEQFSFYFQQSQTLHEERWETRTKIRKKKHIEKRIIVDFRCRHMVCVWFIQCIFLFASKYFLLFMSTVHPIHVRLCIVRRAIRIELHRSIYMNRKICLKNQALRLVQVMLISVQFESVRLLFRQIVSIEHHEISFVFLLLSFTKIKFIKKKEDNKQPHFN